MKKRYKLRSWVKTSLIILAGSLLVIGFIEIAHNRVVEIESNEVLENE